MPPAPGRLSITIWRPQISVSRAATARATTSFDAPGAKPTIQRIGFDGNAVAASGLSAALLAVAKNRDIASDTALMPHPISVSDRAFDTQPKERRLRRETL